MCGTQRFCLFPESSPQVLSKAITVMNRHRAVMERAIGVQQRGNVTEEQRQQYRAELAATFIRTGGIPKSPD